MLNLKHKYDLVNLEVKSLTFGASIDIFENKT